MRWKDTSGIDSVSFCSTIDMKTITYFPEKKINRKCCGIRLLIRLYK